MFMYSMANTFCHVLEKKLLVLGQNLEMFLKILKKCCVGHVWATNQVKWFFTCSCTRHGKYFLTCIEKKMFLVLGQNDPAKI